MSATKKSVRVKVQTITPRQARSILDETPPDANPRRISERAVVRLARDLENGRWQPGAGSLKFNGGGKLVDGQHRLEAIVRAGKPAEMVCIYGVKNADVVDQGVPRNLGQVLKKKQVKYATCVAGIVAAAYRYDKGGPMALTVGGSAHNPTIMEALEYLEDHPEIGEFARVAYGAGLAKVGNLSRLASVAYIGSTIMGDHAKGLRFLQDIGHTESKLSSSNPARALRDRLLRSRMTSRKERLDSREVGRIAMLAWNNYVRGRSVRKLSAKTKLVDFVSE